MGTSAVLANQAENQVVANEIQGRGPPRGRAELVARSERALIKTKVEKELALPYGETATAFGDALVVGGMYALAAVIPLWPYFFPVVPGRSRLPALLVPGQLRAQLDRLLPGSNEHTAIPHAPHLAADRRPWRKTG